MNNEIVAISKDWNWNINKDRFIHKDGLEVSALYLREEMKDWGRPIENVHVMSMLNKLYKSFVSEDKDKE